MTPEPLQVLRCRNCGADVPITSPGTLTVTCEHCHTLSIRSDVELETLGAAALPAPLRSHFQLFTEGTYDGRPFVVRGQIQLDHGAGLWNEWAAETPQGWIWIAEAQGELLVFEELHGTEPPSRSTLPDQDPETGDFVGGDRKQFRAGDRIKLEHGPRWTIKEIGRGDVVTVRGELPVELRAGTRTTYIDLVRGRHEVATLDYTRPGPAELLTGRRVRLADLDLEASTVPDASPEEIQSESVTCGHCGGVIEVTDAERALTLGCSHCGSTLQRATHMDAYRVVEAEARSRREPAIAIGSIGRLGGEELTVIGYLRRSVRSGGQDYPWSEYLLRTPEGAYRWLIESDGHFSLAKSEAISAFSRTGGGIKVGTDRARSFSTGKAMVDTVLGEFYWQVRAGDKVDTMDYVLPKRGIMVSVENSSLETSASLGHYLEPEVVEDAFPAARLPKRRGVGAAQPNPHHAAPVWQAFAAAVVALIGLWIVLWAGSARETVHVAAYGPTPPTNTEDLVQFSDPFEISKDGANLKIVVRAPQVNQGYLDVLGALVNDATGEVVSFTTAAQFYSGRSGGESWSEGNRRGSVLLGRIPKGRYRLRLAARGYDQGVNLPYQVEVISDVPRVLWVVLALLLLLVYPIIVAARKGSFEARRWANSDF